MVLENPKDAIGHKIAWNSWEDGDYFLLKEVNGKHLSGQLYTRYDGLSHRDKFVIGSGIKYMTKEPRKDSYWYLLEELKIFKISKLDDELFEI
ncbi:MAG: hypothetical protein ACXAAH_10375 [Promethearchaeota archaeon]|jgi:hypothetical protein